VYTTGNKRNCLFGQGERYSSWVYNILELDILPWINQGMLYMMIQEMVSEELVKSKKTYTHVL
jgi:hypothetical protein